MRDQSRLHKKTIRLLALFAAFTLLSTASGCGILPESPPISRPEYTPVTDREFFMQLTSAMGQAADWSEDLHGVCTLALEDMDSYESLDMESIQSLLKQEGITYQSVSAASAKTNTWPPDYGDPGLADALKQGFSETNWLGALSTMRTGDGGTLILLITADRADLSTGQLKPAAKEIWVLTNAFRRDNGLPALSWDTTAARIAEVKTQEMYDHDYFEHVSPVSGDLETQFLAFGGLIWGEDIRALGENIAMTQGYDTKELDAAYWMDLWENSPEHRENLLGDLYTHMGAAIYQGGDGRCYAAQEFLTYMH